MSKKKTLVSALTTTLVVGAASTTFAAANPFQDVPADHWAYDAVAQLAADGVIEGYGDGTYRGDQEITRYEMAQMVARAMAKGTGGADKALIDKLAAEFADELNNLGVRVSALEKKVDNVKFYGLFRYTYFRPRETNNPNHTNTNNFRIRLQMSANINEHWTGYGRMEYMTDGDNMHRGNNGNGAVVNRAYVEGKYGKFTVDLGRFPYFTDVDGGMIWDDDTTGVMLKFGDKATVKLVAGRYDTQYMDQPFGTATYQGVELNSDPEKKFTFGASYHHFQNGTALKNVNYSGRDYRSSGMNIFALGAGYRFDKNFKLTAAYAGNNSGEVARKFREAWHVSLNYKGVDMKDRGSFGGFLAYRHLGPMASVVPTYNSMLPGQKGVNFGISYVPATNIVTYLEYFVGKNIERNRRNDSVFARAELYF